MIKVTLLVSLVLLSSIGKTQVDQNQTDVLIKLVNNAGKLEIGTRSTLSLFEHDGNSGFGAGGQFRIWLANRLNTEWYADFISTDLGGLGNRKTTHIGWSVIFYPLKTNKIVAPYLLAGHCFDYAQISLYDEAQSSKSRKSFAIQFGLGNSFYLSKRFDLSLSAQYMMHIGDDIHAKTITVDGKETLTFDDHSHSHSSGGLASEGHILITASINYKLIDLW